MTFIEEFATLSGMKNSIPFLILTAAILHSSFAVAEHPHAKILVVTSDQLKPAFMDYAAAKIRLGMMTEVVSLRDIEAKFSNAQNSDDIQEKIRRFVREKIDNDNVRWVVLGGDSQPNNGGHVPDRDTYHRTMWGESTAIPTDIFYLSKKDWDADNDGIYGEFEDDRTEIDYPDGSIGIGRIPLRTIDDVKAYTQKMIDYHTDYPTSDFANRMIYTCTVPKAEAKLHTSWKKNVSPSWPSGTGEMYFSSQTPWDTSTDGDYALSPANLIKLINEKTVGKFHFHGHGLNHSWQLEDRQGFNLEKVIQLKNDHAYPIITTVSCFTGQFDSDKDPCITEALLRLPQAGAICILAPSREGKPHFADPKRDSRLMTSEGKMDGTTETMTRFWQHALTDATTTGQAFTAMKNDFSKRAAAHKNLHMCICELNLLGDPSLPIYSIPPQRLATVLPKSRLTKKSPLLISNLPAGAEVIISDGVAILLRKTALRTGDVRIKLPVIKSGRHLSVAVRKVGFNTILKHYN